MIVGGHFSRLGHVAVNRSHIWGNCDLGDLFQLEEVSWTCERTSLGTLRCSITGLRSLHLI